MHKRDLTPNQILEAASQPAKEIREIFQSLSLWLDNVHAPSEGGYFEHVVRSYFRKRVPKRFEISTGFISTLEITAKSDGELQGKRQVSRQFDILIWDADTFPPLFRADDFVIVTPESVRAIIEVTQSLNAEKFCEDLGKFDDLHEFYSGDRQRFRPYTALLAFSYKYKMTTLLQNLEKFYLFNSSIPVPFRYNIARAKGIETRPLALPDFIDSICVLDKGLIKGRLEIIASDSLKSVVRYIAYTDKPDVSFGFFERDVVLTLSQFAAEASGQWESSVDVYREFMHTDLQKANSSLIIEDWDSILPSLNVMDKLQPITPHLPSNIKNVSKFVGADFADSHPQPTMYVNNSGSNVWVFERHPGNIFACGHYSKGSRANNWHIFYFDKSESRSAVFSLKEASFSEILQDFKAILERDNPKHID